MWEYVRHVFGAVAGMFFWGAQQNIFMAIHISKTIYSQFQYFYML